MEIVFRRIHRKYGFRFDALAVKLMCEQYGIDLNQIDEIPKHESITAWIYNAHLSYSMYHYRKPRLTYKKTKKFIAVMQKQDWDKMLDVMQKSQGESNGDTTKKKKQHGTNSLSTAGKQEEQSKKS
jgi:hypothetical protein